MTTPELVSPAEGHVRWCYRLDSATGRWWCHLDAAAGDGEWVPGWSPRPASLAEAAAAGGSSAVVDQHLAAMTWLVGALAGWHDAGTDEAQRLAAAEALCRLAGELAGFAAPNGGRWPRC